MPEVTVTLNDVESKDVKVRGEDATVYEFKASDGRKYTTFKRDVAVPGATLRGKLVTIGYTEKQKGEYTNYYLEKITAAVDNEISGEVAEAIVASGAGSFISKPADKEVSIARAVALKAAVETAVGLQLVDADSGTILSIADVYAGWLLTGGVASDNAPSPDLVPAGDDNFPF